MTISDRDMDTGSYNLSVYDLNWQKHSEWTTPKHQNAIVLPRPERLDEMIEYARILSQGFPQVRVDFYHTPKGVFWGEMTFTSACGRMTYYTKSFLKYLGDKIPDRSLRQDIII